MAKYEADTEIIERIVADMNEGLRDVRYDVVETVTHTQRVVRDPSGQTMQAMPQHERSYIVRRMANAKSQDIATLYFDEGGALQRVLVERDVAFGLVPRILRANAV